MQSLLVAGIVVLAVVLASLAGRAAGKRARAPAPTGGPLPASAGAEGELVAVIAAAVSAASGRDAGSFRILGIRPAAGPSAHTGFNTPAWGHVDRFLPGDTR
jgi:hypothetical protein